ncbi:MAG: NAD-dependent epimerase/dehydratase family protein [Chloroflexi bacterium]|nr:NAD-dependent epimerase/dehydratase family protein [Chloroflexota bacterium]
MRAFVTGATGFVGANVARALLRRGHQVRALVRPGSDTRALDGLPIERWPGSLSDRDVLCDGMRGCDTVFHVAALYELWGAQSRQVYEINVNGTLRVMEAALEAGIGRIVHTSSVAAIARPSEPSELADETYEWKRLRDLPGHYERSKLLAEREVSRLVKECGLPAVIVNPTAPIGAFDLRPTPTGRMIVGLLTGKVWGYLDGGINIVDVEDVAEGHVLAAEKGRVGERYILGNRNMTFEEVFGLVCSMGDKSPPVFKAPYGLALLTAYVEEGFLGSLLARRPTATIAGVKLAKQRMWFDSSKAVRELGLPQSSVDETIRKAILWFRFRGLL